MIRRLPLLVGAALLTALATGCTGPGPAPSGAAAPAAADRSVITTRGTGTVSAAPDIVTVTLGVQTVGGTASDALGANSAAATSVQDVLRGAGITDADLRTSDLNVYPTYANDGRRITGYQVTNRVTAVLRDVGGAGAVIDAAAGAAGDAIRVDGLVFGLDDDSTARAQARADAVAQALTQAQQLAQAAGVGPDGIVSITEVPAAAQPPLPYAAQATADAAALSAVPLAPGTQDVEVLVEVVHALS